MAKNYKSLTCEVHDMHLALERAYDKGYEKAREDYSKELGNWSGNWSFIISSDIGEYECSICNRRAFAPHKFCPNCGSSMDFAIKIRLGRITK